MNSLFCRHNRFTADCPICSKGTVLDSGRARERRQAPARSGAKRSTAAAQSGATRYPHAAVGSVRLEKVPGGLRLGVWSGGQLERRAPELPVPELTALLVSAEEQGLAEGLVSALGEEPGSRAPYGKSRGTSGDMEEELRVERTGDDMLRVARWVLRPATRTWELQDAPVMLPARRYAEALRDAARAGVVSGTRAAERPV